MAIFYMRTSIVRAGSKSAVASAAYQAGQTLHNDRLNQTFSYRHKEEVLYTEILLPDYAPKEFSDRENLWNAVEAKENKANSRYARQFVVATPQKWSKSETIERAREFIQTALVDKGMIADWALHYKDGNPHLHIMTTIRGFNDDGSWATMERKEYSRDASGEKIPEIDSKTGEQKVRHRIRNGKASTELLWKRVTVQTNNWNKRSFLHEVKKAWADQCNRYLSPDEQIDWRSYKEQGINRIPLVHEGPEARAALQRGIIFDSISENQERLQLNAALARIETLIIEARKLLEELRLRLISWRYHYDKARSTRTTSSLGRNGITTTLLPDPYKRTDLRIGENRTDIRQIKSTADTLEKRTERIRRKRR